MKYKWQWQRNGRMRQVALNCGEDIAHLSELDRKQWLVISCPTVGVRFDQRTLALLDANGDGRIRTPEVLAAIEFLKAKGVSLDTLFTPPEGAEKELAEIMAKEADLAKIAPSAEDERKLAEWRQAGAALKFGENEDGALRAVEAVVEGFFTPADGQALVIAEPDVVLPLREHLNPKYFAAIQDFAEKCVRPILGERAEITRLDWARLKAVVQPYRDWLGAKPAVNEKAMDELVERERVLRYQLHLREFLENFANLRYLYSADEQAIFQTGMLRIDAREFKLCFDVASEAAHAALAEKSKCCVIYAKLTRPSESGERTICAVVTAGTVGGLYVGRNGVFYDRDGKDWEATITKVVENQVSLAEAFWAPWRKLGDGVMAAVKKFIGDKQAKAMTNVSKGMESTQAGGAAMASSVAALGIGVGMVGAAAASIISAVKGIHPWWMIFVAIAAVVLVVSLPSVILTWFKLRQRDLSAILNAGGWAVNRPLYFSNSLAKSFTDK